MYEELKIKIVCGIYAMWLWPSTKQAWACALNVDCWACAVREPRDGTVLYKQWQVRTSITVRWKCLCPQLLQKWHLSTSFISVRVSHSYTVCSLFNTQFTLTLHGSQPKIILHGEEHFWRRSFMWSRDFPSVMQPEVSLSCSQEPANSSCPVEFQSRPQPL